jgi:Fe-S cluster assembly ATP-binding protein
MLVIKNLHVAVDQTPILNGVNFSASSGKVYVIMGPNGSGKSTLAHTLAGQPGYTVTAGSAHYQEQDLLRLSPEARAQAGLFVSFQYPVEIPGVSTLYFLKTALNSIRQARKEPELDAVDFLEYVKERLPLVGLDPSFLYRPLNEGFSGGEKKRNEILQLVVLEPSFIILDEADSGLDIDSLKMVADVINRLRAPHRTFLIITHYQRLLQYVEPDHVSILQKGTIVKSGGASLAHELDSKGYEGLLAE